MSELLTCPACQDSFETTATAHLPDDRVARCPTCQQPFNLGSARHVSLGVVRRAPGRRPPKKRDTSVDIAALFVSFFIPGVGHLIKSRVVDGMFWVFAYAIVLGGGFVAFHNSGEPLVLLCGLVAAGVIVVASALSAFNAAQK